MLNTIITVYLGVSLYYTCESIKKSFTNNTVDEDLERNWKKLKDTCYYIKCDLLRKKYRKKDEE